MPGHWLAVVLTASDVRMRENYVTKGIPETSYTKISIGYKRANQIAINKYLAIDEIPRKTIRYAPIRIFVCLQFFTLLKAWEHIAMLNLSVYSPQFARTLNCLNKN